MKRNRLVINKPKSRRTSTPLPIRHAQYAPGKLPDYRASGGGRKDRKGTVLFNGKTGFTLKGTSRIALRLSGMT